MMNTQTPTPTSTSHQQEIICCSTGLSSKDEISLKLTLKSLNIKFKVDLDYKIITHLIVNKVGTSKHELALKKGLNCVSIDWIKESNISNSLLPFENFPVPIFCGLTISVTQLPIPVRDSLQKLVETNGGKFCRSLDQGVTTHLIALEPSGDKYEHALSWNIHVCSPDWIHECVKLKCWQPEVKYKLNAFNQSTSTTRDMSIFPKTEYSDNTLRNKIDMYSTGKNISTADSNDDFTQLKLYELLPSSSLQLESESLSSDIFFISGFDQIIQDYCLQLILTAGGRLHHALSKNITKVLIGPNINNSLRSEIFNLGSKTQVVTLKWLINVCGLQSS